MYPCHGLHYYICVLYTCINKSYKSIITPLHLVLWPTVKNKLLQEPLGPTLFLSLLSRRDVMWRENCQISQTRCSHERRNFQSRTKVVYTKVPGKYVVSFLAIDLHHNAMCLSWACKTNRVIAGVRVEQPMCWMSGWCQGQDNDVFAAHSITIRTEGDHPRSIFNGAVQLAIFVLIWIWNCSWLCRWCLKVAAMINPLKTPLLLHNTAWAQAEGLIFARPGLSSITGRVSFLYKDGLRGVMWPWVDIPTIYSNFPVQPFKIRSNRRISWSY